MGILSVSYLTVQGEVLSETRSGVESDYIPDPLGSTAALTNSSQAITDTFSWWPYGDLRSHSVGSNSTPFGYVGTLGYYADGTTGRTYVRTSTLIPSLTRWQRVDYLWPRQSAYTYVRSGPTSLVDSMGSNPTQSVTRSSSIWSRYSTAYNDDCDVISEFNLASSGATTDPGLLARYQACVDEAGAGCPTLGAAVWGCLAEKCDFWDTDTYVDFGWNLLDAKQCGSTLNLGVCNYIQVYVDMIDDPRCNHFGAGAPYHIVLLHELLHTCGIDHGNVIGDLSCNNIIACCMLRAKGLLPKWQRCRQAIHSHAG